MVPRRALFTPKGTVPECTVDPESLLPEQVTATCRSTEVMDNWRDIRVAHKALEQERTQIAIEAQLRMEDSASVAKQRAER